MSTRAAGVGLLVLLSSAAGTPAAVVEAEAGGFVLRHELHLPVLPRLAYRQLVRVGAWWNPEHTYSGDARRMSIDARAGGCFCERLDADGTVEHMRVIQARPGKLLRMAGALGPLQEHGVTGTWTLVLQPDQDGTLLKATYEVGGYLQGGFRSWAPLVDQVLGDQLQRLARQLEKP